MPLSDQLAITRVRQVDSGKQVVLYDGTNPVSGWILNVSQIGGGKDVDIGTKTMTIQTDDLNNMEIQFLETVGIKDAKKITISSSGNGNVVACVLYYSS